MWRLRLINSKHLQSLLEGMCADFTECKTMAATIREEIRTQEG